MAVTRIMKTGVILSFIGVVLLFLSTNFYNEITTSLNILLAFIASMDSLITFFLLTFLAAPLYSYFYNYFVYFTLSFYAALLFMVVGLTDFIGGTLRVLTSRESTTIVSVAMATLVFFTGVPNPLLFNLMYGAVSLKLLLPISSAKTAFLFLFPFLFYYSPHLSPLLNYEIVGIFLPLNEFYNLNILSAMVTASIVPVTVRLQIWGERQRKTNFIVGLLKSRDHVKIDEIASRLGISSAETEAFLIDLMARNKIRGKITKEGEFISAPTAVPYKVTRIGGETQPVVKEVVKEKEVKEREIVFIRCRHCGTKVVESESKCPNCGAAL